MLSCSKCLDASATVRTVCVWRGCSALWSGREGLRGLVPGGCWWRWPSSSLRPPLPLGGPGHGVSPSHPSPSGDAHRAVPHGPGLPVLHAPFAVASAAFCANPLHQRPSRGHPLCSEGPGHPVWRVYGMRALQVLVANLPVIGLWLSAPTGLSLGCRA